MTDKLSTIDAVQLPDEPRLFDHAGEHRQCVTAYDYRYLRDLLKRCKHNSGVTMDELGEIRDRAEAAEAKLPAIGGRNRSLLSVRVGYAKTGGKMSKADELFKKYQADGWIGPTSFKAALREYGAMVRKEDDTLRDLLELKQLVTTMMEFKRREWVGLMDAAKMVMAAKGIEQNAKATIALSDALREVEELE